MSGDYVPGLKALADVEAQVSIAAWHIVRRHGREALETIRAARSRLNAAEAVVEAAWPAEADALDGVTQP